jgi:hypothetical protein
MRDFNVAGAEIVAAANGLALACSFFLTVLFIRATSPLGNGLRARCVPQAARKMPIDESR